MVSEIFNGKLKYKVASRPTAGRLGDVLSDRQE